MQLFQQYKKKLKCYVISYNESNKYVYKNCMLVFMYYIICYIVNFVDLLNGIRDV